MAQKVASLPRVVRLQRRGDRVLVGCDVFIGRKQTRADGICRKANGQTRLGARAVEGEGRASQGIIILMANFKVL